MSNYYHLLSGPCTLAHLRANRRKIPKLTPEEERVLVATISHSPSAKERLFVDNLRHVVSLVNQYSGYRVDPEDLYQAGVLGLWEGVDKLDPSFDNRPSTFLVKYINSRMLEEIRRSSHRFAVPGTSWMRKLFYRLRTRKAELLEPGQRWLNEGQIGVMAVEFDVLPEQIRTAEQFFADNVEDLDSPVFDGEEGSRYERLAGDEINAEDDILRSESENYARDVVAEALRKLNPRQRLVANQRMLSQDKLTLQALSDMLGVSKQRVEQIEKEVKSKIKETLAS